MSAAPLRASTCPPTLEDMVESRISQVSIGAGVELAPGGGSGRR